MKSVRDHEGVITGAMGSSHPQAAFRLVFLTVVGIVVLAGAAEIIMAAVWTNPTPNQQIDL